MTVVKIVVLEKGFVPSPYTGLNDEIGYVRHIFDECGVMMATISGTRYTVQSGFAPAPLAKEGWVGSSNEGSSTILEVRGESGSEEPISSQACDLAAKALGWGRWWNVRERQQLIRDEHHPMDSVLWLGLLRKRQEQSSDEFVAYWNDLHVPMVLNHDPLFTRYVTNFVLGGSEPWDGIVQQWFGSRREAEEHIRRTAEDRPQVSDDIGEFVSDFEGYLCVSPCSIALDARSSRVDVNEETGA